MQSTRLFPRNNQKLRNFLPRRIRTRKCFVSVRNVSKNTSAYLSESGSTSSDDSIKVTVIGAAGRVGRTLSLLLKTSPLVDQLCMFDIDKSVKGYCLDISHIDTNCCVNYVCGMRNVEEALDDPDVVFIAAGSPSSQQTSSESLFRENAPVVAGLSEACARFCPEACIVLITNPINSLLPVAGEVYELVTGEKPSEKLFGLTTLDVVRANTFTAEATRRDPSRVIVPVIGGASSETIVPVISQMKPCCKIKHEEIIALTECVKQAEGSLTDCQNCGTRGSSSLSTAYAAFRFSSSLISALKGGKNIVECAYVRSNILPELEYMASPLKLGTCGIEYNYGYPKLSDYEVKLMENGAVSLRSDIEMGKLYVNENKRKILKSVENGFASEGDVESEAKNCKIHNIVEINEPVEAVSLMNTKSDFDNGNDFAVRSEETGIATGYSAVLPNFMKRVVVGDRSCATFARSKTVARGFASATSVFLDKFRNLGGSLIASGFKRLFHTRITEPYCPARRPDGEGIRCEIFADEEPVHVPRASIEETKRKIREYYEAINESERKRAENEKADEEERKLVERLGLDPEERRRRVKKKLVRTRRERLRWERGLSAKSGGTSEGSVEELREVREKNWELLAKPEPIRVEGSKSIFAKILESFGFPTGPVSTENESEKRRIREIRGNERRKNSEEIISDVKYPFLSGLLESNKCKGGGRGTGGS